MTGYLRKEISLFYDPKDQEEQREETTGPLAGVGRRVAWQSGEPSGDQETEQSPDLPVQNPGGPGKQQEIGILLAPTREYDRDDIPHLAEKED
jgi:hypothetical protein